MQTALETGELKSTTALATSELLLKWNNLFVYLNSKNLYDANNYKCAISEKTPILQETLKHCFMVRIMGYKPMCFEGLRYC